MVSTWRALGVRQVGDGQQQLAPLAQDLAFLAGRLVGGAAEIEQPAQALIDPWPLLAAGLEIDLLGRPCACTMPNSSPSMAPRWRSIAAA